MALVQADERRNLMAGRGSLTRCRSFAQFVRPPLLELSPRDVADRAEQAAVVPPVDPLESRELKFVESGPQAEVFDEVGL